MEKTDILGGDTNVNGGIYNTPDEQMQAKTAMTDGAKTLVEAALAEEMCIRDSTGAVTRGITNERLIRAGFFELSPAYESIQTACIGRAVYRTCLLYTSLFVCRNDSMGSYFCHEIPVK